MTTTETFGTGIEVAFEMGEISPGAQDLLLAYATHYSVATEQEPSVDNLVKLAIVTQILENHTTFMGDVKISDIAYLEASLLTDFNATTVSDAARDLSLKLLENGETKLAWYSLEWTLPNSKNEPLNRLASTASVAGQIAYTEGDYASAHAYLLEARRAWATAIGRGESPDRHLSFLNDHYLRATEIRHSA